MSVVQSKSPKFALSAVSNSNTSITSSWTTINHSSVSLYCSGNRPVWIRMLRTTAGNSGDGLLALYFNQATGITTTYNFRLNVDGVATSETIWSQHLNMLVLKFFVTVR